MDDNALEELSLAREPRQRGSSKDSMAHVDSLPKFSEWAAGRQSSLDTDILNKHVKQMVEVSWIKQAVVAQGASVGFDGCVNSLSGGI